MLTKRTIQELLGYSDMRTRMIYAYAIKNKTPKKSQDISELLAIAGRTGFCRMRMKIVAGGLYPRKWCLSGI